MRSVERRPSASSPSSRNGGLTGAHEAPASIPITPTSLSLSPTPPPSTSSSSAWWLVLPIVCFFQIFLLYRWSRVSHMVVADHRLLYRKARDMSLIQQAVEEKVLPGAQAGAVSDALVGALVGNISARLEAREVELLQVGMRLLEREKELSKMQEQLIAFLSKPRTGRGPNVVMKEDGTLVEVSTGGGGGGEFPPAPPVPATCNRQKDVGRKGKVQWNPVPGRYLLVMCSGGQLSNRISCMRQHMLDAALLNRTLVLPSSGIDYNYENLLDLSSPKTCFGADAFMTLDEFAQKVKPTKVKGRNKPAVMFVDVFVCHVHSYQTSKICATLIPKYEEVGILFAKPLIPDFRTPSPWYKYKSAEMKAKFSFPDAQVIAFGNMFGVGGADHRFRGSAPLAVSPKCKYYIMPSKPIMSVATGFINTYLGSKYISLHLRRGDFYDHCVIKGNSAKPCYHPLQQLASCIERRLAQNPGFRMMYLSTNGDDMEVQVLKELLQTRAAGGAAAGGAGAGVGGGPGAGGVSLVRMPELDKQAWAEPLIQRNLHKEPEVVSLVEKTISVMAPRFYGTAGSTYSGDICRLRDWLFTSSCADGNICPDQEAADTRKRII